MASFSFLLKFLKAVRLLYKKLTTRFFEISFGKITPFYHLIIHFFVPSFNSKKAKEVY